VLVARGANALASDDEGDTPLDAAVRASQTDPCCAGDAPDRLYSALIAFLTTLGPMAAEARRDAAQRSWDLWVAATLQDAIVAEREPAHELPTLLRCLSEHLGARDYDGTTALHAAAHAHRHAAAQLLLDCKPALVGVATPYGESALHVAAREGAVHVAQLLVARGADGRARNRGGRTPCDLARRHSGSDEMIALLEAAESEDAARCS
jgi:ankyrin repeat protein